MHPLDTFSHTLYQHTLSTHPINRLYSILDFIGRYMLSCNAGVSTLTINTPYQHTLPIDSTVSLISLVDTCCHVMPAYQHSLSTHPTNRLYSILDFIGRLVFRKPREYFSIACGKNKGVKRKRMARTRVLRESVFKGYFDIKRVCYGWYQR